MNQAVAIERRSRKPPSQTFHYLESVGFSIANRVVNEVPLKSRYQISPMPVEHLIARFGISLNNPASAHSLEPLRLLGLDGLTTQKAPTSSHVFGDWFNSDHNVDVLSRGFRSRFTLTHELAHVVLSREYSDVEKSLSPDERERVCDIAAAIMLCPEEALVEHFKLLRKVTVHEIERLAAGLQISISLLLNRLRYLVSQRKVSIANVILLVSLNRSRKRKENFAPRVASACGPAQWFVPLNSRLSSIGLSNLQEEFFNAPLYSSLVTRGVLRLWDYGVHATLQFECDVNFRCYSWVRDNAVGDGTMNRIMLAVANRTNVSKLA